jgi:SAM-dependent methyltransferase
VEALLDKVHGGWVHARRVEVLSRHLAALIPPGGRVLDLGCGDGLIGGKVAGLRTDLHIVGMDIDARADAPLPVQPFDGRTVPMADRSIDTVLLVDVLHHASDPLQLLREANRVADDAIVLKDVTIPGRLDEPTLRFMDWVGNARHGVPLPYNFWSQREWREAFARLGLRVEEVRRRLNLYPRPFRPLFERRMHFIARLTSAERTAR